MECYCYLRNIQDLLSDGKTPHERRFGEPSRGPIIPFGAMVEYLLVAAKDLLRLFPVGQESFTSYQVDSSAVYCTWGESGTETSWLQTLRSWKGWTLLKSHPWRLNAKELLTPKTSQNEISGRRRNSQTIWRRSGSENIHLNTGQPRPRRRTKKSSRRMRRVFFIFTSRLIAL